MSKRQLTPRQKLKRDLEEFIALRALATGSDEWNTAIQKLVMRKQELSPKDLQLRNDRHREMGSPELHSAEWKAELARLKAAERGRSGKRPVPLDPDEAATLTRDLMSIAVRQAAGIRVELKELPGQNRYNHTKEQRAAASRLYRWLWRRYPGQLRACDDELRELIRKAGGVA